MQKNIKATPILDRRRAGILLHPTSLPGPTENGDFGPDAYHFIDFLCSCGTSVWQMLPLVPTHADGSPYMGVSVLAGNTKLISLELLKTWGWLRHEDVDTASVERENKKRYAIQKVFENFATRASQIEKNKRETFLADNADWLLDYALFQVMREQQRLQSWVDWPASFRDREPSALAEFRQRNSEHVELVIFEQFIFFRQFQLLKDYANDKGVLIFGDMPIFVAHDSAEVWAHREHFNLFKNGLPRTVAGVPPDYFSETGQRWGNPHYNWKEMRNSGFSWWIRRLQISLKLFDLIRVDHFRGFEAYWEINASEPTAMKGRWKKAPGKLLFNSLLKHFESLPFIAEDLGVITAEVEALRDKYGWPGMKILHFAFDGNQNNPYLPHNHTENSVVYTGTHDNDTTMGWYRSLDDKQKQLIENYLIFGDNKMPWPLIRCALASTARLAILPMQDLLPTEQARRMNTPGRSTGNWNWRFDWQHVDPNIAATMLGLNKCYDRAIMY